MLKDWPGSFILTRMDHDSPHLNPLNLNPLEDTMDYSEVLTHKSSFTALWAALRFVYRDATLEGDTPRLRRQLEGITDYELTVLKAACSILMIAALDEMVDRKLRSKGR